MFFHPKTAKRKLNLGRFSEDAKRKRVVRQAHSERNKPYSLGSVHQWRTRPGMETLDRTLRHLKDDDRPMGGAVVLFAENFRQNYQSYPEVFFHQSW